MNRFKIIVRRHIERRSMIVLSGKDKETVNNVFWDLLDKANEEHHLGIDFTDEGILDHIEIGDELHDYMGGSLEDGEVWYEGKQREPYEDDTELELVKVTKLTSQENRELDVVK